MALTNSQYYAIMRDYERTRLNNHDIQTARYREVCQKPVSYTHLEVYKRQV